MRPELLKLRPKRYRCPYCGKWHPWEGKHLEYYNSAWCIRTQDYDHFFMYTSPISFYFEDGYCYYKVPSTCGRMHDIKGKIAIKDIIESSSEPRVNFYVKVTTSSTLGKYEDCSRCRANEVCIECIQGDKGNGHNIKMPFGFEFDKEEYYAIVGKNQKGKDKKEDSIMKKATTIWDQLYKHSPEENVQIAKEWAGKYKPTLKWAVPVVTIYAAYRILNSKNSGITVKNIEKLSTKNLGFAFDSLKDKKSLSHLMQWGKVTVGAYAGMKAVSAIYHTSNPRDLSVEQLEDGMEKLEGVKNKFSFIQPKTEALLPVAVSVIIVYIMTQKPAWFETVKEKAGDLAGDLSSKAEVYSEIVKLFLADKLHINLDDEEEKQKAKKFAFLAVIIGVCVLLYGKKVIGVKDDTDDSKTSAFTDQMQSFLSQVINVMKKLMPTAFAGITAWLVSKKFLSADELLEDAFFVEDGEASGEEVEEASDEAEHDNEDDEE